MLFLILGVSILLACLALLWRLRAPSMEGIPGPPGAFFVGNLPALMANTLRYPIWQYEMFVKYGQRTWGISVPGQRMVFLSRADNVEHIMSKKFDMYIKGPEIHDGFYELFQEGLFGADGERWRQQRKATSHLFSAKMLRGKMHSAFIKHGQVLCTVLQEAAHAGRTIDIQQLFFAFTFDGICDIAFGMELDNLHKPHPFMTAFDAANVISFNRVIDPLWRLKKKFGLGDEGKMRQYYRTMNTFLFEIVDGMVAKTQHAVEDTGFHDVLTMFISEYRKKNMSLDRNDMRDVIMTFVIAGRDTTGWTLTIMHFLFARYPHLAQRVYEEIKEQVGDSEPDYHNTLGLVYTQAFMLEALRLYPAVPAELHFATADDVLPDGTQIRAGDMTGYPAWTQGRDTNIWGPDALTFNPDRWLDQDKKLIKRTEYEYSTFNAGPRICLGREMAVFEVKVALALVMRRFRIEATPALAPDQEPNIRFAATLSLRNGLPCRVYAR